jgi:hypothetical protein
LTERIEIPYTAKQGSWQNMAEMGIGVLSRQWLNRRITALEQMRAEVNAWAVARNKGKVVVQWQFASANARIKLRRLYPKI